MTTAFNLDCHNGKASRTASNIKSAECEAIFFLFRSTKRESCVGERSKGDLAVQRNIFFDGHSNPERVKIAPAGQSRRATLYGQNVRKDEVEFY